MTSREVARRIEEGIRQVDDAVITKSYVIGDGGEGTVGASIGMSARPEDGYPCCKIGRRGIFFIKLEVDRRVRLSTSTFFILTV